MNRFPHQFPRLRRFCIFVAIAAGMVAAHALFTRVSVAHAELTPGTFHRLTPQECGVDVTNVLFDGGAGVAFADLNGDDLLDIYVAMGDGVSNYFYLNNGDGYFTDVASTSGVGYVLNTKGVKAADYDNDGDTDLFITNREGDNRLYQNDGTGNFTDVTVAANLDFYVGPYPACCGACWGDYDLDGYLDLYVINYGSSNILFRNKGDGTFENTTFSAGVDNPCTEQGCSQPYKLDFEAVWVDYNNDRYPDLYIATDFYQGNTLYHNNGDGTFTDVSVASGAGIDMGGMGIAVTDVDDNGYMDIYVTNEPDMGQPSGIRDNVLFMNNGDGTFTRREKEYKVTVRRLGWGCAFLDYDNDGDEDLYVVNDKNGTGQTSTSSANMFMRNDGASFTDVTDVLGVGDDGEGFGCAVGDYNNDGFVDMFVHNKNTPSVFYQNVPNTNNWIKIRLVGTVSNRDGVGARIRVRAGGGAVSSHKVVMAGASYLSQHSTHLVFGLGTYTRASLIRVTWPSGIVDVFNSVPGNRFIEITEGQGMTQVPVFITGFNAIANDDGIAMDWSLVSDEPMRGFRILRREIGTGAELYLGGGQLIDIAARSYVDADVRGGTTYEYSLIIVMPDGSEIRSQPSRATALRAGLLLEQNYPNPFNPTTSIRYSMPEAAFVELAIHDVQGRRVAVLVNGFETEGPHEVLWDGRDLNHETVGTGVYFYRLRVGERILTRKMLLVK